MRGVRSAAPPRHVYAFVFASTPWLQVAVVGLGLLLPPLAVAPLEFQRRIVDDALPAGDLALLGWLAGAIVAAAAASALLKFVIYWLRGLIEAVVTRRLRLAALAAQAKRRRPAAEAALGPTAAIVAEEAYPLGGFAAEAINTPLIEGAALLGLLGFMLVTEPALALIGAASLALQAVVAPIVQTRINRLAADRVRALRRATSTLISASERRGARFRDTLGEVRRVYRLRLAMNVLKAALKAFLKFTDNLAVALVLLVGGAMVVRGETSLGVVVAFLSGMNRLRDPWDALIGFYREFADAQVKYALIRGALGPEVETRPAARPAA
jgi:ABC-type bacteriocin/lantibiotic exporter with double-glycine peptidase domain